MGAESSIGRGAENVIVIDSSDEDFQRHPAPPVRQKRSLALRALVDESTNSGPKHEDDAKPATADKKRKTFPVAGTLKCAPVVDLRPLLQQAKLRVRLSDGTYAWPHHLRMNIENLEAQRKSTLAASSVAEEKCGDAEEECDDTEEKGGDAEEKCVDAGEKCDDAEEKCGDAEETTTPGAGVDVEEKGGEKPKTTPGTCDADEKTTPTAPGKPLRAVVKVVESAKKKEMVSKTPGTTEPPTPTAPGKPLRAVVKVVKSAKKKEMVSKTPGTTEPPTDSTTNRLEESWRYVKTEVERMAAPAGPDFEDSDFESDDADGEDRQKGVLVPASARPCGSEASDFESDDSAGDNQQERTPARSRQVRIAASAGAGSSEDSDFESDDSDGDDWQERGRQIRVAASRAAATGALSPAQWPSSVVHLREMFNPANIQLEYAHNFGLCSCESMCRHQTCMNASLSLFCAPNCCQFAGHCGNALVESDHVAIATRGDNRGLSLVATKAIEAGTILGQYLGEMVLESAVESDRPNTEGYRIMMFRRPVNARRQRVSIDARRYGSMMRFMNHSCVPVAKFAEACNGNKHTVIAVTTQDILAGEEITVDYGDDLWFECECGEPSCRDKKE